MSVLNRSGIRVSRRNIARSYLRVFLMAGIVLAFSGAANCQTGAFQVRTSGGTGTWSTPSLDVSQFSASGDLGAMTAACVAALPSGGTCDARALTGTQFISAQLVLSGKPLV